jgi:DNA helicase IV
VKLPTYQELSREQDAINGLPLDGNWLVTGPPGTGKTVMALYRAKMLTDQQRPVKMLVWSRLLRMYIEEALETLNLDDDCVSTFDSWLWHFWNDNNFGGRRVPYLGDNSFDYDWDTIHDALNEQGIPKESPDMIIDEGQDLPQGLYLFARKLCDHLTVFADEDQTLDETRQTSIDEIQKLARIKDTFILKKNYRNSRVIAELALHFHANSVGIPELPDASKTGPKPRLRSFSSWDDSVKRVATWAKNNEASTVGVFLPKVSLVKQFTKDLQELDVPQVQSYHRAGKNAPQIDFDQSGVLVSYYKNAKGLEFDAVFVCGLDKCKLSVEDPLTRNLLYVLTSRARTNLEFHYAGIGKPPISALFPNELLVDQ